MPSRDLDVRRDVTLTPRGGSTSGTANYYFLPKNVEEVLRAVTHARELLVDGAPGGLTPAGAERSFEAHFVPRASVAPRVVLSSQKLRGDVRVLGETTTERGVPALAVRARAGTSFGELLGAVRAAGFYAMPFSCPTAEAISLGGALAVNTHGRMSATYGGLFAEHVRRFTLLGADGRSYDCHAAAESELERRLFRYVPGALGALGFVTEMELELAHVAPDAYVVQEILHNRRGDPAASVASYLAHVAAERRQPFFGEGIGLVFFGAPGRGTAVIFGERRAAARDAAFARLPLLNESARVNMFVQAFAHRVPKLAREVATRILAEGRTFSAPYYRWLFFQSSYDDGVAALERRKKRPLFGFEPTLGLVHQAWVLTTAALPAFFALASDLFATPEFEPVARGIEWFDVLRLPAPSAPLDPSRAVRDEGATSAASDTHVITLSVAVRDARSRELASSFCRTLVERAVARGLAVVVQLNKQHHVEPALLRRMHRAALAELGALKHEVDPDGFIGSRSLERLGLDETASDSATRTARRAEPTPPRAAPSPDSAAPRRAR
ncbi:MAG TPA: FAD-binding protein [Polyangiaceae bacterium]|nr:FAD-binding protein [Polyangiaceae bacterium]